MQSAVKITYSGGEVIFEADEVLQTLFSVGQDYQVHRKQDAAPKLAYFGEQTEQLQIVFNLARIGTEAKIDAVVFAYEELTVYYAMGTDPTKHFHCVPLVDGMEAVEVFGQPIAKAQKSVTFLKSAV